MGVFAQILSSYKPAAGGATSYPTGAAALYSLDELNGWTGLIFRAFRLSDVSTQDFYMGATEGSWNTTRGGGGTDFETWSSGTTSAITIWYDQSGNGNNAFQNTYLRMPQLYVSGAVHTVNGKAALKCDGTQTYMELTTPITAAESFTAFIVGNRSATNKTLWGFAGISYGAYAPLHYSNSFLYGNSRSGDLKSNSTDSNTAQCLLNVTMAGGTRTIRKNGSDVAATFTSSSDSANFDYILGILTGAAEYTDGYAQELGLYSSDQSGSNTDIESTANTRFSIW